MLGQGLSGGRTRDLGLGPDREATPSVLISALRSLTHSLTQPPLSATHSLTHSLSDSLTVSK